MKWEYHFYSVGLERFERNIEAALNELGQQGSELVTSYQSAF